MSKTASKYQQFQSNEPTDQELIIFNKLLKSNNPEAKQAFDEYSATQNKEQFYEKIIKLCRNLKTPIQQQQQQPQPQQQLAPQRRIFQKACYLFRDGKCTRGNDCRFEHTLEQNTVEEGFKSTSNHEAKEFPRERKDVKPVCHFFETGGVCRKADRCRYQHPNGVREGNQWKNPQRKETPSATNKDNEVAVAQSSTTEKEGEKQSEIDEEPDRSTNLLNLQTENLKTIDIDEPLGRSILQDPTLNENLMPKQSDQSQQQGELNSKIDNFNETPQDERIKIFEFLVDHNDHPLLSSRTSSESESIWMALNLAKINNSFEGFPVPEDEENLLNPMQRDSNRIKQSESKELLALDITKDEKILAQPEIYQHPTGGGEEFHHHSSVFHHNLGNESNNLHVHHALQSADPKFSPNAYPPGPEYPSFYPPPPHMMPPHQIPPPHFMMPNYHPGMYPPPHMMGMNPYPPFPGMYPPPHMPPYPPIPPPLPHHPLPPLPSTPDAHRNDEIVNPSHLHSHSHSHPPHLPRMPFPYPYPYGNFPPPPPPQFYGDGSAPMPPQFYDNSIRPDQNFIGPDHQQHSHRETMQNLSSNSKDQAPPPLQDVHRIDSNDEMMRGFENLSAADNRVQTNSRFRFDETDSINSLLPQVRSPESYQEPIFNNNIPSMSPLFDADLRTPSPAKNNDPKAQVLLSFLHAKGSNSQSSHIPNVQQLGTSNSPEIMRELDHLKSDPEESTSANSQESPPPKEESSPPQKFYRVTRNQPGRIRVSIHNNGQVKGATDLRDVRDESSITPGGQMMVYWELPHDIFNENASSLVVALTRLGSSSNSNNIVTKDLKTSKYIQHRLIRINPNSADARGLMNEEKEHDVATGEISFHAPKAAGYYVYRIFDNSSDEKRCITLATSTQFVVELRGRDVAINLKFAIEAIGKTKSDLGSLGALRNTFELMRSTGTPFQGRSPQSLIQECVLLVLDVLQKQIPILNERDEARRAQMNEKLEEHHDDSECKVEPDSLLWQKARSAQKVHIAVYDCLFTLRNNIIAWGMLTPSIKQTVSSLMNQFCQFERRFFDNMSDMYATRSLDFGFVPCPPLTTQATSSASRTLSNDIKQRVGSLMPTSMDFHHRREEVRSRLRTQLCQHGVIPPSADLAVFGSSRNNFGTEGADLDMCLQYGEISTIPVGEQRGVVMEALGAALTEMGMLEVQTRSTARIPIVIFKDPISGLDCDISFNNPLAIRNTLLLASYSAVDVRVRELAFIIKYWAKQRYINNPQEGTLSSYGYILCLIHFLQMRNPPLLPNLQAIPPDWEPNRPLDVRTQLPKRWEKHPVEDCYCNTYYYDLTHKRELQKCQSISSNNHQSIGELLIEFFRYFAYEFDYHTNVISIRVGQKSIPKLVKTEIDCWGSHDRLSIEDPFETWYDVAHVIKGTQMSYMRKEFLRAYTLICRSCTTDSTILGNSNVDSLPQMVQQSELFEILTTPPTEIPKFAQTQANKQARSRANTLATENDV